MTFNEEDIFFEFPKSQIKGIPLICNRDKLSFGFVEVGCKPNRKRIQLRDKKQLFYKYWADEYKHRFGVNWFPDFYRILVHYDPKQAPILDVKKSELDVVIQYDYISPKMISSLTQNEKKKLCRIVKSQVKKYDLNQILEEEDSESLHELIVNGGKINELSYLRGCFAEILALKDISQVLPFGINFYKNGDINYFNKRYDNGTEVDGILTFYREDRFKSLVERLSSINHLIVRDRWS